MRGTSHQPEAEHLIEFVGSRDVGISLPMQEVGDEVGFAMFPSPKEGLDGRFRVIDSDVRPGRSGNKIGTLTRFGSLGRTLSRGLPGAEPRQVLAVAAQRADLAPQAQEFRKL